MLFFIVEPFLFTSKDTISPVEIRFYISSFFFLLVVIGFASLRQYNATFQNTKLLAIMGKRLREAEAKIIALTNTITHFEGTVKQNSSKVNSLTDSLESLNSLFKNATKKSSEPSKDYPGNPV